MRFSRVLALITALSAGGCAAAPAPGSAAGGPGRDAAAPAAGAAPAGARYFHAAPDDAFWVTREGAGAALVDRVVVGGARLELDGDRRVLAAAWEAELWADQDPLIGSLAVAPHLGGGFVHWTKQRAFRSRAFTGPLEEVALGAGGGVVHGARSGLRSVVVFTSLGPRALAPGEGRARALDLPAIHDLAALDASRAARLDVFGRAAITADGGATWADVRGRVGLAARGLVVAPGALAIDTPFGQVAVQPDGSIHPAPGDLRPPATPGRSFQPLLRDPLEDARDGRSLRGQPAVAAAVIAGAPLPDGAALAVAQSSAARIDARTGALRARWADWLPPGLGCAAARAGDAVLFLCAPDDYDGRASYVLRSALGEAPRLERAFSAEGYFVAGDDGALGFVGGCAASERDQLDEERRGPWGDVVVHPKVCVRRGPGAWVERAIEPDAAEELVAWVPRKDGGAIALVRATDAALPEPVGAPRRSDEGGVRVIRVSEELQGWHWTRPVRPAEQVRASIHLLVDRRFRAREDGGVDGWLSSIDGSEAYGQANLGVSIAGDGAVTAHPLPPDPAGMVVTGDHGVLVTRDASLYETVDHGRTWRPAGRSPVPPSSFEGVCSPLGCVLAGVVRLGWGPDEPTLAVATDGAPRCGPAARGVTDAASGASQGASGVTDAANAPLGGPSCPGGVGGAAAEAPGDRPVVSCAPVGLPAPRAGAASAPAPHRRMVSTPYGETLEIVTAPVAPPPQRTRAGAAALDGAASPGGEAPPDGEASPGDASPRGARPATERAYVRYVQPFDLRGPILRQPLAGAELGGERGAGYASVVPLLAARGGVTLLVRGETSELLVGPAGVQVLPAFEPRRSYVDPTLRPAPGLLLGPSHALVLGELRRRLAIEEHTQAPRRVARAMALEPEELRSRPMALALRDDGAVGVLVLDGAALDGAGVAALDRLSGTPGEVTALAPWATLTPASDARCRAQKGAWRALVMLDPRRALRLDPRPDALPPVTLGDRGMAEVRWGRERVCLEALQVKAADGRRRGEPPADATLVARWAEPRGRGSAGGEGVLRTQELAQRLACTLLE